MVILFIVFSLFVPLILLACGKIWISSPPDRNDFMGYRTRRSRLSDETWKYAHAYASKFWYKAGVFMLAPSVLPILLSYNASENIQIAIYFIIITAQVFVVLFPCVHIEKYLKDNFDEEGKPKK